MVDAADKAQRAGRTPPLWFWLAAAAGLLFEAFGCLAYLIDVTRGADELARLPVDQRSLRAATPDWMFAAYAVAVWSGLAGAILLLLRRRHAQVVLLVSLVALVVQFGGVLLVPRLRDGTPPDAFTLPIVVVVLAYGLWHVARRAGRHGWLR